MSFPQTRMRRLRKNSIIRNLVNETKIDISDLVMPLFVCTGKNIKNPIPSMPGNYQLSIDNLISEIQELHHIGIQAILLFGIPEYKDEDGSVACDENGIVQRAIKEIKASVPNIWVIADICNCEYTSHGHCGIIENNEVENDKTIEQLAKQSVSIAKAGADMVAPSDMMDGRIQKIRKELDAAEFQNVPIMSYSAKFASSFYGPFRDAAECSPQFGDRKTYQMNPANSREALREVMLDIEEGADIIMIKPALSYLDIIYKVKEQTNMPVAAYNVSGEFSMVKAAGEKEWINEMNVIHEILLSIKRAGADIIITYHAKEMAQAMQNNT